MGLNAAFREVGRIYRRAPSAHSLSHARGQAARRAAGRASRRGSSTSRSRSNLPPYRPFPGSSSRRERHRPGPEAEILRRCKASGVSEKKRPPAGLLRTTGRTNYCSPRRLQPLPHPSRDVTARSGEDTVQAPHALRRTAAKRFGRQAEVLAHQPAGIADPVTTGTTRASSRRTRQRRIPVAKRYSWIECRSGCRGRRMGDPALAPLLMFVDFFSFLCDPSWVSARGIAGPSPLVQHQLAARRYKPGLDPLAPVTPWLLNFTRRLQISHRQAQTWQHCHCRNCLRSCRPWNWPD